MSPGPTSGSSPLEIFQSPGKTLGFVACGVLMTAVSLVLVVSPQLADDGFARVIGTVGALFFGLCTALWLRQMLRSTPVVTISPEGLRDVRVAREVIPWSAVERVSMWSGQGQRFVVLAIAPEVERGLTLTRIARWTRAANRRLGADGLIISAHGLRIDVDSLSATIHAHAAQHR